MDRSNARDVIAFAGRPDAEGRGSEYDGTPYSAFGYECSGKQSDDAFPVLETKSGRHGPNCRTVFWINLRTRKLGDFYTSAGRYSESHGVSIGMSTARAERLLHKRASVGCGEEILLGKRNRTLTIALTGGSIRNTGPSGALRLSGGHVYAFALHGWNSDIGIFDCL